MAEAAPPPSPDSHQARPGAPKDKTCQYCQQAFTSSSLGRHLDLFVKDKNPKPPDGVHDIEEIRKLRGSITRRHPRNSTSSRKASTSAAATPKLPTKRETSVGESDSHKPAAASAIPRDGHYAVDSTLSKYPLVPRWQHADLSAKSSWDPESPSDLSRRASAVPRSVNSRQTAQKAHFDVKQKLADVMDTARAAELALREIVSSYRAAKRHKDDNSMPFGFDPQSLDFPALALRCLCPPPTLFSSTQHPTPTSWSVESPGQREFDALNVYFRQALHSWKLTCASTSEELNKQLASASQHKDAPDAVRKAEMAAVNLERQVEEHLQSAYAVWQTLPPQRQQELWVLELARGVGRKHKETETLKAQRLKLEQENANLKSQIDQLNRRQQPPEFQLLPPATVSLDRDVLAHAYERGVKGGQAIALDLVDDTQADLSTVITKSIEKWKNVISATRSTTGGMTAQKALDHATFSPLQSKTVSHSQTAPPSQPGPAQAQGLGAKRLSTASTRAQTESSASNSIDETSDQDADAEMEDDDSFAIMDTSPVKPSHASSASASSMPQPMLDVPRSRGLVPQQQNAAQDIRFMMPSSAASPASRSALSMSRSMANMNMTMQGNSMSGAEMGMMQPVRGDAMYNMD
ncbi:hypothetical protein L249_2763 [Ophiocordyceps polyrhachis-furcata BCC 54312]|uniref:Uncharacterized protein n=1 Tax=Ophiocordyceps polyrhachis-furcata BCC 54312 TaxID=1330021 RepID=A0A367LQV8_9HYPO|nr:hypothetical protein L249_2763 [Ophiocordyceps polyrhachis-furcata BCC 54312]